MGRAESAALGTLATGLSTGIQTQLEERKGEKYAKRQAWLQCIMSAQGSPESCAQTVGYQPEGQEMQGAESMRAERLSAEDITRQMAKRKEMRETAEKYTPTTPQAAGAAGLDIKSLLPSATITPEGTTLYPKISQQQLAEESWKRGEPERAVAQELRTAKGKREFAVFQDTLLRERKLWERKMGFDETTSQLDKDIQFIKQKLAGTYLAGVGEQQKAGVFAEQFDIKPQDPETVLRGLYQIFPEAVDVVMQEIEQKTGGEDKTQAVANKLQAKITSGEYTFNQLVEYIDKNAGEYKAAGVDPERLKTLLEIK
jgi:hypothetical protein